VSSEGDTYFRNAFALGICVIFPKNGRVGGPGGKFRGRRLAKKYFERVTITKARQKHIVPTARVIFLVIHTRFKNIDLSIHKFPGPLIKLTIIDAKISSHIYQTRISRSKLSGKWN
jgi:hypothetical protein